MIAANVNLSVVHFNVSVSTVFLVKTVNKVAKAITLCLVVDTAPVKSLLRRDYSAYVMHIIRERIA